MKTKQKQVSPVDRFLALSDAEKDAEVAPFEKGTDPKDWKPLNCTQRKQWKRIKKKLGRPKIGKGSKMVAVTIEIDLLKRMDAFAKAHKLKRSQAIAKGLHLLMQAG